MSHDQGVIQGNFQLQAQLPNGKQLSVQTFILAGEGPEQVNARLDMFNAVIDRLRRKEEIPQLEAVLDQKVKALGQAKDHLAGMENKREVQGKLNSKETLDVQNMNVSIQRLIEDIDKGRAEIEQRKKEFE